MKLLNQKTCRTGNQKDPFVNFLANGKVTLSKSLAHTMKIDEKNQKSVSFAFEENNLYLFHDRENGFELIFKKGQSYYFNRVSFVQSIRQIARIPENVKSFNLTVEPNPVFINGTEMYKIELNPMKKESKPSI